MESSGVVKQKNLKNFLYFFCLRSKNSNFLFHGVTWCNQVKILKVALYIYLKYLFSLPLFFAFQNNLFCTQLVFVFFFHLLEDFDSIPDYTDDFCFSSLESILTIFAFFFTRKTLIPFMCLFLKTFFVFLIISRQQFCM